jgi:putative N6-adenine-specific DNA methylase
MPPTPTPRHAAFAVAAPGLAPLVAEELRALGFHGLRPEEGGVAFDATPERLMLANLWLRVASRVVVRLVDVPGVTSFRELERVARLVPWETLVMPGVAVRVRATCRKSKLYHSDAVAERVGAAIVRAVGGVTLVAGGAADDESDDADASDATDAPDGHAPGEEPQLVVVRFFHDRCTISADSSGALLHRRGWRQAVGRAPLRETLAAAMLHAAGYDGSAPLLDPLCGSGTIAIEAALRARRVAPGRHRRFAFERWPGHDADAWQRVQAEADARALPRAPHPILASDRDAGAVAATRANAERAGVGADVQVEQRPLSGVQPPGPGDERGDGRAGWVVTNPPYGKRVGERGPLRDLYARLGDVLRVRCPGWQVALLSADPALDGQLALALDAAVRTRNGGLAVRVLVGRVPEAETPTP